MQMNTATEERNVYSGLEPHQLWRHFEALNRIPRASGREAGARAYVEEIANAAGATFEVDAAGNVVVRVLARSVRSDAPIVAIQAHLDMVCEKRPDIEHNFARDPIRPQRHGDLLYASGTTLGADNGIGVAAALALLTTPGLQHGPLELVFTVEEETGLHGALALDAALLRAEMLINLDSEDPDELTIGCAGGAGTTLYLPLSGEATPAGWQEYEITVSGLKGGHSGVQIHEPLANALKLLARVLSDMQAAGIAFRLSSINGGSAHNAIPRDAAARLAVAPKSLEALGKVLDATRERLQTKWAEAEPGLSIEQQKTELSPFVLGAGVQEALVNLLEELPHGVLEMSDAFPGKVQTSTNLAHVETNGDEIEIATSSRSFIVERLSEVQNRIRELGARAGARVEVRDGYPGWEPDAHSHLLQLARNEYESVYGKPARVEVVHAGLECGVIVSKKPALEAISFGPLICGAHSPEEHVALSTVPPSWKLLTAILSALA
jgi:dipeptidase D